MYSFGIEPISVRLAAKIASGAFEVPSGTSYTFAGSYENQVRSERKLKIVMPLALFIIFNER